MKIAMVLRPDWQQVYGGDTVVMRSLGAALARAGAQVTVGRLEELPPATEFDLLHSFALTPVAHAQAIVRWAQAGGVSIIFSPLYYADYRDWFERAVQGVPRWQRLAQAVGQARAWQLYRAWQQSRLPIDPHWQAMRMALLSAAMIVTSGRWENDYLAVHFRLPAGARARQRVSPLGINAEQFGRAYTEAELSAFRARHGLEAGYVAEVGRLEVRKNQLGLIEALWDDPVQLVFVGSDSPYYDPGYGATCRARGEARDRTRFVRWLADEELPMLYAASAVHALPSTVELPGLVSLEAGACGTRIVSTSVSPLRELLGDGAWYCDPYDRASIAAAVRAALASPRPPGLRERLLSEFAWDRVAAANLTLYDEVLRGRVGEKAATGL